MAGRTSGYVQLQVQLVQWCLEDLTRQVQAASISVRAARVLTHLGLLAVDAEELGVEGGQLAGLELAAALGHVGVHEVLPLALVAGDHVLARSHLGIELRG